VVFTLEVRSGPGTDLDLCCVPPLVARWREALISQSNGSPPWLRGVISGHDASGAPLQGPHLAFVPMASVGYPGARGHLLGMAAALPAGLTAAERHQAIEILSWVRDLKLGGLGVWGLVRETRARPSRDLRPDAWTAHPGGATHWATVTPVAFDRHPKAKDPALYQREVAQMIAVGCVGIGLPQPREVVVTPVSAHLGVPPAHVFPRLVRKDGGQRRHAHAILVFDEPVRGPMLVGAGRYRGYGVCRPVHIE
jgi:CRISPR-associated protein Csb2